MNHGELPEGKVFVDEMSDEIKQFNKFSSLKLGIKTNLKDLSLEWSIPDFYKNIDIDAYVRSLPLDKDRFEDRKLRRDKELELFKKYDLINILKVVIFIVDVLRNKNIVWGTGRGSSCSSYLFYLIGLHSVDVVKYDIPIHDFFKQEKQSRN